jgi:hypothetical protein
MTSVMMRTPLPSVVISMSRIGLIDEVMEFGGRGQPGDLSLL